MLETTDAKLAEALEQALKLGEEHGVAAVQSTLHAIALQAEWALAVTVIVLALCLVGFVGGVTICSKGKQGSDTEQAGGVIAAISAIAGALTIIFGAIATPSLIVQIWEPAGYALGKLSGVM